MKKSKPGAGREEFVGFIKRTCLGLSLLATMLVASSAELNSSETRSPESSMLETGTWWNLYFVKEYNPLSRGSDSIRAVKIVGTDPQRPSWVRIRFPKSREDHVSIFGPASEAHGNDDVTIEAALAEWEQSIDEWRTMWVNLDYVVYVTRVGEGD